MSLLELLADLKPPQPEGQEHSHLCPSCHVVFSCGVPGCRAKGDHFHMECLKCSDWEKSWPYPFA